MHQLVKLTDAIWFLQLVISSPLIHALGDVIQVPTRIQTPSWESVDLPTQLFLHPF